MHESAKANGRVPLPHIPVSVVIHQSAWNVDICAKLDAGSLFDLKFTGFIVHIFMMRRHGQTISFEVSNKALSYILKAVKNFSFYRSTCDTVSMFICKSKSSF